MGASRLEHGQAVIGRPLEQVAQVVAVGVEGPPAVAGQKGYRREFCLVGDERLDRHVEYCGAALGCHDLPPCVGGTTHRTPP